MPAAGDTQSCIEGGHKSFMLLLQQLWASTWTSGKSCRKGIDLLFSAQMEKISQPPDHYDYTMTKNRCIYLSPDFLCYLQCDVVSRVQGCKDSPGSPWDLYWQKQD